ncbi:sugar phosphate nucleotidyltransferase [Lysinibacillus pakistanensis]|uniref:Glucose-1-phosphate thymidylyltransferase n=1 Tax=Lysinibacillus pakistanensis TaxID=759811 RepID=A0ABX6D5K6_9BACI|nr:NTP transferase domain-containing protein [Lysinibacillus pakistanensis]
MKGIILAGGNGTRLHPLTKVISKHLLPVYDKPMIYYPIQTLEDIGVNEILIISTERDLPLYQKLLENEEWGIKFYYKVQKEPKGIAEALILGEEFIGKDPFILMLGDNLVISDSFNKHVKQAFSNNDGATIFGIETNNPSAFGIAEIDGDNKVISIDEKPANPKSNIAVIGIYIYNNNAVNYAKQLKPSKRGELEITDINKMYLEQQTLKLFKIEDARWFDTGTIENLYEAASYIKSLDK